jgi:hypothetical protein
MKIQPIAHRWALVGLMGLGVSYAAPSFGQPSRQREAQRENRAASERQADRRGDEYSEPIKFDRIPERPHKKLEEVKKDDKVITSYLVHYNHEDHYRVVVHHKKAGRVILVNADGQLMNVEDIRDAEYEAMMKDPDAWLTDYDNRMFGRAKHYAQEAERVTGTPQHPEEISLDQVPGPARVTLLREAAGDRLKLKNTIRYKDNQGNVIYQCNIPDDPRNPSSVHMVQVLTDGRIFNEGDFSKRGERLDDWRPKTLGYEDLPGRVKETVDREAPRGRIPHIDVARRGGREIYTVEIDQRGGTRYLTIGEDGKILSDVSENYEAARR